MIANEKEIDDVKRICTNNKIKKKTRIRKEAVLKLQDEECGKKQADKKNA